MKNGFILLAALLVLPALPMRADTPPRYKLTVLPFLLNANDDMDRLEVGGCLNGRGQVAGTRLVRVGSHTDYRTVLWQKGHALRTLDKTPVAYNGGGGTSSIFPAAMNSRGDVVGGYYYTFDGASLGSGGSALLWQGGRMITLPGLPGGAVSVALGVSDTGLIVGNYLPYVGMGDDPLPPGVAGNHAFLWRAGHVKALWPGVARAVNDRGEVAGVWDDGGGDPWRDRGVLWRGGHVTFLKMQPIAINGRGWAAGSAYASELKSRAYLWKAGQLIPLTKQISKAYALNLRGDVVGEQDYPASSHSPRATLWRRGQTYDLNRCVIRPRGWMLDTAVGINGKGWIVGRGSVYKSPSDKTQAREFTFLLTPL